MYWRHEQYFNGRKGKKELESNCLSRLSRYPSFFNHLVFLMNNISHHFNQLTNLPQSVLSVATNTIKKDYVDLVLLPELLILIFLEKMYPNFLDDINIFYNFYIDVDNFLNNDCLYQEEIDFSSY